MPDIQIIPGFSLLIGVYLLMVLIGSIGCINSNLISKKASEMEVIMVHDIPAGHPRTKYFNQMISEVLEASGGLTITMNPGGNILYHGKKSLDAVIHKTVPLTLVNTALLASLDPRIGFVSLPFSINDELMKNKNNLKGVQELIQRYLAPSGLKILGIMRGADTIFVMKEKHIHNIEDVKGMRIRISAPGVYEDIIRSLGGDPVAMPAAEIDAAFKRGELDGMVTSPSGWVLSGPIGPKGSLVPGLIFYTYSLIADQTWFDSLPTAYQNALEDASFRCITEKWQEMRQDDMEVISDLLSEQGEALSFSTVPVNQLDQWKKRVERVENSFKAAYTDVVETFKAKME